MSLPLQKVGITTGSEATPRNNVENVAKSRFNMGGPSPKPGAIVPPSFMKHRESSSRYELYEEETVQNVIGVSQEKEPHPLKEGDKEIMKLSKMAPDEGGVLLLNSKTESSKEGRYSAAAI
mmetsp:Transcript_6205/g.10071  ORF Transcript_6205/g.10071 Transcript_6205/m.10071 type:complete len:121 (+) Transcript_6205:4190-4552(+)